MQSKDAYGEEAKMSEFYNPEALPQLHPDSEMNLSILVDVLCAHLNQCRRALGEVNGLRVVTPEGQHVKVAARYALDETDPRRMLPRSASYV